MLTSPTATLAKKELKRFGGGAAEFKLVPELPSFEISRQNGKWLFAAPNDVELLYAVYDCAERFLGYDFFEPGVENFDPAQVQHELPQGVLVPARQIKIRRCGFIQEFPFDPVESPLIFDFMAKNKLNYLLVWMKYYDDLSPELKEYAAIRGITIESGHHNFEYLIPVDKYGKDHPEYFATRAQDHLDKEIPGVNHVSRQLCTTEPGLRQEVAKQLLAYQRKNPELTRLGLNPNDGFGWCECPRCSAYYTDDDDRKFHLPSARRYFYAEKAYNEFITAVAQDIHRENPDLALNFFGYVNYSSPAPDFKLTLGIAVQYALYWRCVKHDLFSDDCPTNRGFLRDFLAWEKSKAGGEFMIYEYYMGINFYMSLPLLFWQRMFDEFEFYHQHQVDGVLTQFQFGHWSSYGSNYRFMAQAARGENFAAALQRFYERRFGKYAAEAESFYNMVAEVMKSFEDCHIPTPASLFSRISVEQLEKLLPPARRLARKLPNIRPAADLPCWVRYLIRFKKLYDLETARTITPADMEQFITWIKRQRKHKVLATEKVLHYIKLWKEDVEAHRICRFFDVDWPAEFRRRRQNIKLS
ncbi:MAG: DUF4838 domain-containing protein [Lentisphaerae bacterium]|nr:DUF4838 domain-containing protein [Lentisphaerota bacterium]